MGHWNSPQAGDACPASKCSRLPPGGRFWIPRKGSATSRMLDSCQQNACPSSPPSLWLSVLVVTVFLLAVHAYLGKRDTASQEGFLLEAHQELRVLGGHLCLFWGTGHQLLGSQRKSVFTCEVQGPALVHESYWPQGVSGRAAMSFLPGPLMGRGPCSSFMNLIDPGCSAGLEGRTRVLLRPQ